MNIVSYILIPMASGWFAEISVWTFFRLSTYWVHNAKHDLFSEKKPIFSESDERFGFRDI